MEALRVLRWTFFAPKVRSCRRLDNAQTNFTHSTHPATSKACKASLLRKTTAMMVYHNNRLTTIGLEREEDYSYPTPKSNKRKRDSALAMQNSTDHSSPTGEGNSPEYVSHHPGIGSHEEIHSYDYAFNDWAMDPLAEAHGSFSGDWNLNGYSYDATVGGGTTFPTDPGFDQDPSALPDFGPATTTEALAFAASQGNVSNEGTGADPYMTVMSASAAANTEGYEANMSIEDDTSAQGNPFLHSPPPDADLSITVQDDHYRGTPYEEDKIEAMRIKDEESDGEGQVSFTPFGENESDESDYEDQRPAKMPKLNKDGVPRKPRQPRPKLLKWQDDDWKRVCLGIVWACGDNGIQIPFEQASQIISESCTAGALQQALLKLRGKQVAEGHQIPPLKMAWTRKGRNATPSKTNANTNASQGTLRKKPTRVASSQTLLVRLKRPYREADRQHLAQPYIFTGRDRVGALGHPPRASATTMPPPNNSVFTNPNPFGGSAWNPPRRWKTTRSPQLANSGSISPSAFNPSAMANNTPTGSQHQAQNVVPPVTHPFPNPDAEDPGCLDGVVSKLKGLKRRGKSAKATTKSFLKEKVLK